MSEDSNRNSVFNAAFTSRFYHLRIGDLDRSAARPFVYGGTRHGGRTVADAQELLNQVPSSHLVDKKLLADYMSDKHISHIQPHSKGGSDASTNLKIENGKENMIRRDNPMTAKEQRAIDAKANLDNLTGAVQRGMEAGLKGAVIGAVTTLPFSFLRNALRVSRGEMTSQEAAMETGKETLMGGAVGGVTAFTVTAVASAFPPIAIFLTAVSPALLVAGGAGMVYEFFKILEEHKHEVRDYYNSLTEQQLSYLQQVEDEMTYEHKKNLRFLDEQRALSEEITNRPRRAGIEGAFERLQQSIAIAESMGLSGKDSKLLGGSTQRYLSANS